MVVMLMMDRNAPYHEWTVARLRKYYSELVAADLEWLDLISKVAEKQSKAIVECL